MPTAAEHETVGRKPGANGDPAHTFVAGSLAMSFAAA